MIERLGLKISATLILGLGACGISFMTDHAIDSFRVARIHESNAGNTMDRYGYDQYIKSAKADLDALEYTTGLLFSVGTVIAGASVARNAWADKPS